MRYDRLLERCAYVGINISSLLKEFDLTTANTGKWKHGGNPSVDILIKLADRLNTSTDYLLGRDSFAASATSPNEMQLIEYYLMLNEDNQKKAIERVHDLTKVAEYRKDAEIAEETHVDSGKRAM